MPNRFALGIKIANKATINNFLKLIIILLFFYEHSTSQVRKREINTSKDIRRNEVTQIRNEKKQPKIGKNKNKNKFGYLKTNTTDIPPARLV